MRIEILFEQYVASNIILADAMEQGDKRALSGVRNPILEKADPAAAPSSSLRKVRGDDQQGKKGAARCWSQALLGLVTPAGNLHLWEWAAACLRASTIKRAAYSKVYQESLNILIKLDKRIKSFSFWQRELVTSM